MVTTISDEQRKFLIKTIILHTSGTWANPWPLTVETVLDDGCYGALYKIRLNEVVRDYKKWKNL